MSKDYSRSASGKMGAVLMAHSWTSRILVLLIAALLTVLINFLSGDWLRLLDERLGSLGWTLFADKSLEERITLVVIDEASIAEVGAWPWDRETMSRLVTAIDEAGAQLQIHDIVYPDPREGDDIFLAALQSTSGTVIAQLPALNVLDNNQSTGTLSHSIGGMKCSSSGLELVSSTSFVAAAPMFEGVPKGHNSALIDRGGGVRKSPALLCVGDSVYPSLALAAFMQLGSSSEWGVEIETGAGILDPFAGINIVGYPGLSIPVDSSGSMRIDFGSAPESFRAVSAREILAGEHDPKLFDNAWVLVGGTAFGMADIVPTPYSGASFGIELQARMLASILDMQIPYTPSGVSVIYFVMVCAFAMILFAVSSASGKVSEYGLPFLVAGLPLSAFLVHLYGLSVSNVWIGWVFPAGYGLIAAGAVLLLELAWARSERGRVYQNLASYLSPAVARDIAFKLPTSQIEAKRQDVILLNVDIRNFSSFGESRAPEEIAAVLHFFTSTINEIVETNNGQIAEIRGDSIIAMWAGATTESAQLALWAARKIQSSVNEGLLTDQKHSGTEPLALGIGIEQGPVLVGSIGPSRRRSFTVLGGTVTTTLRIQEMTAELAQPILLGSAVSKQLPGEGLVSQGSYLLPGLLTPHTLFAPPPTAEIIPVTQAIQRASA